MDAMQHRQPASEARGHGLSLVEFVGLIALMMALTALSVDIMLPALPAIGQAMGVDEPNDRQAVIIFYLLGFSVGQLAFGRLSDRWGRKPMLMVGLAIFLAGSLLASIASDFTPLLVARGVQGLGAAAPRVIALAIMRDLYAGREMARIMSFAMSVFIIIPVLAPALGQGLLLAGNWRWTFDALLVVGVIVTLWSALRLPETRSEADARAPLSLWASIRMAVETPQTLGYAVATSFMFGCLLGFVSSAQQVFVDVFQLGAYFPVAFGAIASMMALASFLNAQLVERLGMRRVSHWALTGFAGISLLVAGTAALGIATLPVFAIMVGALFFLVGLIMPNFNALAMEPQGHNAGMASSFIGFTTTACGALFGGAVGYLFDGTVVPLAVGFAVLSLLAFAAVVCVEGWRGLYRPSH
jgi:MFS transporter, DHA1 family, multidrug resistance protein